MITSLSSLIRQARSGLWRSARLGLGACGTACLIACLSACISTAPLSPSDAWRPPEAAGGSQPPSPGFSAAHMAVAAANPLAAAAGLRILKRGGSALDAAVAVQMVLGLVEPQSSGIGGGAMLMHWDGRTVQAWDGRETAPAAATPGLFLKADGTPMGFAEAVTGGRAVGVPGVLRMLEAAHREHGRLPWARLFDPAIELADQGFAVSPRLHALLRAGGAVQADAAALAFFYQPPAAAGAAPAPWPVGHVLRNPAMAELLRRIAREGSEVLYRGPVAAAIVQRVQGHATNAGVLGLADLAAYRPLQREALCTDWRDVWRICGFPPPSSGHLAVMQILGLLEALPPREASADPQDGVGLHRFIEASRLAFADRARFVADPAFVTAPGDDWQTLLAPGYLRQRAALIREQAMGVAPSGEPGHSRVAWAPEPWQPEHGTSHISIVDAQGQAVAMTTTIESGFGSGLLCDGGTGLPGGFLLNNELTDFSFMPADAQGRAVANRVEPGKRPRSSMSPTLVFDRHDGHLVMTLGSPGGAGIIGYTAKTLLGVLASGLAPQHAIDLPNLVNMNTPQTWVEKDRLDASVLQALRARGQQIVEDELTSGIQALRWDDGLHLWVGGADRRREGVVLGE